MYLLIQVKNELYTMLENNPSEATFEQDIKKLVNSRNRELYKYDTDDHVFKITYQYDVYNRNISEEYHFKQNMKWKTSLLVEMLLSLTINTGSKDLDTYFQNHPDENVS